MSDRDEWRDAVRDLSEAERATISPHYRRVPGQIGEPGDDTPDEWYDEDFYNDNEAYQKEEDR